MNMIRNYLESLFANLPNTAEVSRAKDELGQMMEDKYAELISQGVSENEALSKVISEFGNIDEIASDLGLDMALARKNADGKFAITMDVVKDYILDVNTLALRISLGVALLFMCPIMPVLGGSSVMTMGLGLGGMFMLIFGGIFLFILGATNHSKWKLIKREPCFMDYQTTQYVKNESEKCNSLFSVRITLGIMLCAMCWLPLVILSENHGYVASLIGSNDTFGVVLLFVCIAFGVMLIISAGIVKSAYIKLLRINDRNTIAGNYYQQNQANSSQAGNGGQPGQPGMGNKKPEKYDSWGKTIMGSYWPGVTCIYLVYSFTTMTWATSWLIWPLAAFAHPIIAKALKK